jgi:hypothetical protein
MPKKKMPPEIEITELILITPDSNLSRKFIGCIDRRKDVNGNDIFLGTVVVDNGKIWSMAYEESHLLYNLDNICKMKLDLGLHEASGIFTILDRVVIWLN